MADIITLCEALAASLDPIPDLAAQPYLIANPTPPAAEVQPGPVEFDKAMGRGADKLTFIVRAFVGIAIDQGAQRRLYPMLSGSGEYSIKAAIEADRTLGGACDFVQVTKCSGPRLFERHASPNGLFGAEWTAEVLAHG